MAHIHSAFKQDIEKWEQLETERANTIADPKFQSWVKELNISQSYEDREGIIRANELNSQYNYSNAVSKTFPILNLFK